MGTLAALPITTATLAEKGLLVKVVNRTITTAEILDWHNTAIELVAAQGANKIAFFIQGFLRFIPGGTQFANAGTSNVRLRNMGTLYNQLAASSVIEGAVAKVTSTVFDEARFPGSTTGVATADVVNKNIDLFLSSASPFTAGDGSAIVTVAYGIMDLS